LFIDASGMAAVLRRSHQLAPIHWPTPRSDQVCRAFQYTYEVRQPEGAHAFCQLWRCSPGDSISFTGPSNGFSIVSLRVSTDVRHVDVLVGTLEADSPLAARDLLRTALEDHPWIGRPLAGGGGRIPLAPPYDRLGAPGLALLGDAANQVLAAHGSGIGLGLASASILCEQVAAREDLGSADAIGAYERAFLREFGALTAGYDAFRRHSSELGPSGIQRLFDSGLFDGEMAAIGLAQRIGSIPLRQVPRRLAAAATHPRVAFRLAPTLVRMQLVRPLYYLRPDRSHRSFAVWQRLANGSPRAKSM
jgi:flavin-dependent dehydrogenase